MLKVTKPSRKSPSEYAAVSCRLAVDIVRVRPTGETKAQQPRLRGLLYRIIRNDRARDAMNSWLSRIRFRSGFLKSSTLYSTGSQKRTD
jgi:hypothetical protein